MEMQRMASKTKPKSASPPREELRLKECTSCKGELVLDAQGAAVFCEECWTERYFELSAD